VPRISIRSIVVALFLCGAATTAATGPGAEAGFAVPQPTPQPTAQSGAVTAATAPHLRPRVLRRVTAYLAPPLSLRRPAAPAHRRPRHHHRPLTPREIGRRLAAAHGWSGQQWTCLDELWTRESNWHVHERNSSSGAYGIPQSLPATKMASAGRDWRDNAVTQIHWGLRYIAATYGTPCGAWAHSQSDGYY
jgi:hypothetical protein